MGTVLDTTGRGPAFLAISVCCRDLLHWRLQNSGGPMAKYLMQVSYTADGAKGLVKDGGSKRREVAGKLIQSLGGKMEAFYFAFGETDAVVLADLPDNGA